MFKSLKRWVFTALIMISVGLISVVAAFYFVGFHVSGFNTVQYEAELTPLDKPYDKIVVDGAWCDVIIMTPETQHAFPQYQELFVNVPSVYAYNDGNDIFTEIGYSEDSVLHVVRRDLRPWYKKIEINVRTESDQIVLFLDDLHFDALEITTSAGNIWLLSEAEINEVQMQSSSGELFVRDLIGNSLTMKSSSGDIIGYTSSADHILLEASSGDISLDTVHAKQTLHVMTTSGEIDAANVTSDKTLALESTSGDIEFTELHAADGITLESTSGDIEGSLSGGMRFSAASTSGEIKVPADVSGAPLCVIKTTSGDIEIQ